MNTLHLITVGKLKEQALENIEAEYKKRFSLLSVNIHEVKSHEENLDKEANEILKKISTISKDKFNLILLSEHGKLLDSPSFSSFIFQQVEIANRHTIFVIGGSRGFGKELLNLTHKKISLSPMTFPHKIARILFIEQLYRAETICLHHPYHK